MRKQLLAMFVAVFSLNCVALAFASNVPMEALPVPPPVSGEWSTWRVAEEPTILVNIWRGDSTWISLHYGANERGHACLDGRFFVGALCATRGTMARARLIRISRASGNRLRVLIRESWDSPTAVEETWEPIGGDTTPLAEDTPELPDFGEYVYTDELPEKRVHLQPHYPEAARRAGVDGVVMVQALVGRDGRVWETRVVKSIPLLDAAAVRAVERWEFAPAMSDGKPVAVWVGCPVKFSLR